MAERTAEEWKQLINRASRALGDRRGVDGVGIGDRVRGRRERAEPVLRVFVSRKLARSQLRRDEMVPPEFEGVATDVAQTPRFRRIAAPGASLGHYTSDETRSRPLIGGQRIQSDALSVGGTLGFFVKGTTQDVPDTRVFAVTNAHVLFKALALQSAGVRVGQPEASIFARCCHYYFGTYPGKNGAYLDDLMDVGLIQLYGQQVYSPAVLDIGNITGQLPDNQIVKGLPVQKRGFMTRLTGGTIKEPLTNFIKKGFVSHNVFTVQPNPSASGTPTFADGGDSGSAVLDANGNLVGILFAAVTDPTDADVGMGVGYSIATVMKRFSFNKANLTLETGGGTRVAPGPTAAETPGSLVPLPVAHQMEADLTQSAAGQRLTELWVRHASELNQLVRDNRRVGVLWQRAKGPDLLQAALRSAYHRDNPFPTEIAGRPVDHCVADLLDLFARYGSPSLGDDIRDHRALLPSLAGLSYNQVLAQLRE
jgi:hypothetical protein